MDKPKRSRKQDWNSEERTAWEVFWRLRAALGYVDGARKIAGQNQKRWPVMSGELEQVTRLMIVNMGTAEAELPGRDR